MITNIQTFDGADISYFLFFQFSFKSSRLLFTVSDFETFSFSEYSSKNSSVSLLILTVRLFFLGSPNFGLPFPAKGAIVSLPFFKCLTFYIILCLTFNVKQKL